MRAEVGNVDSDSSNITKEDNSEDIPTKEQSNINKNSEGDESEEDESEEDDSDYDQTANTFVAMEEVLKPKMLILFDKIGNIHKKMLALQDKKSVADDKKHSKYKADLIILVKEIKFHPSKIETLIDKLYGQNSKLMNCEINLLDLATKNGITRESFVKEYKGQELSTWLG